MKHTMTIKEAAARWNISERRITTLCREGRIADAEKNGRSWTMPADTQKPADLRIKNEPVKEFSYMKLPLPIGISDYRLASQEYYYVDKTLLIKDFLDERVMVSLFTRPRRFGKTLNMDMLKTFFEKSNEDTSIYFKDKKIWQEGAFYQNYQGKYPVIFITFKDVKKDTWDKTLDHIIQIITEEYKRHQELSASDKIQDKDYYEKILSGTADRNLFDISLYLLSKMLHEHYGTAPIVIIDEYDTPIQQGHTCGFYDEAILFMRNLFSGVFKDNKHLSYGFLTGILRVAKESIFSGLNNLTINSILDDKYSEYFGFTPDEVKEMTYYYSVPDKYEEICSWYDGYRFGTSEIFNPWSVINYFRNNCQPRAYWQATGNNDVIGEVLTGCNEDISDKLRKLLQGENVVSVIDTGVLYPQLKSNPSSIFSFLLVAGYLKAVNSKLALNGDFICEIALPNKEIAFVYRKEILQKLDYLIPQSAAVALQEAFYTADVKLLKKQLELLLLQSASCFNTVGENFYHGFLLGLCAAMEPYLCSSNKEAGYDRYDIQLKPKNCQLPGVLIELKAEKNCSEERLKELAATALNQIEEKKYDTEMRAEGISNFIKYGAAFSGKSVFVVSKND